MLPMLAAGRLGESSNSRGDCLFTQVHPVLAACLLLGLLIGCSSDEPAAQEAPPVDPRGGTAVTSPNVKSADTPESDDASAASHASQTAFRTMTTQNITPAEWEAANQTLQQIGPPALPTLVEGLKAPEKVKREMASTLLAWFGPDAESAADDLIAALDDESPFVRANVATALLQMPDHVDRVVPVFAQFLQSDDADLKLMAATNLTSAETDAARPLMEQLIAVLDDENHEVVNYAAQLLGRMGPDAAAALPKLRAIDVKEDAKLEASVATALLLIEPPEEPAAESP